MGGRRVIQVAGALGLVVAMTGSALAATSRDGHPHRSGRPTIAGRGVGGASASVRVYRDHRPWSNRDLRTLESMGLTIGDDVIVEPMAALRHGVPYGTELVILSSNADGTNRAARQEASPKAQASLVRFLRGGGVLIAGLADNLDGGGYTLPLAEGTPDLIFPKDRHGECRDASLTPAAMGDDGLLGTADDHPLVIGPDETAGTDDDLTERNIDMASSCYVAHGNLVDGITLPRGTTWLETATFRGVGERPITGEYCVGQGRVIATTVTMEYEGHRPAGKGPAIFLRNLYSYALGAYGPCHGY
jgi:hypothetical protein